MQNISKFLLLLNDGGLAEGQQMSFRDRKAAELRAEKQPEIQSGAPAGSQPSEEDETPDAQLESVQDGSQELHDDGDEALDAELSEADLDEEIPADDEAAEDDDNPTVDWEKRFKDTQAELTRVNEEREERNAEHADMMAGALQLRYELEDELTKVKESNAFVLESIDNQIQQLERAFSSGQIEPDRMAQARQMYSQLGMQRNVIQQRLSQAEEARERAEKTRKSREAEITRVRLRRSIPDWSERKYAQMRQEAVKRGYTVEEFNDITDHRYFEMLHDSMMLRSANDAVTNVRSKRKPKPPRGRRNAQTQPRDDRGRYEKAQREFRDNPGERGRFAAMAEQRLKRERRGR